MKKHQKVRREDDALVIQNRNSFRRNSPRWRKALTWAVTAWTLGMAPTAYALESGAYPILDAAGAGVTVTGTTNMSITANPNSNNLIKWVEFSIGEHNSVTFDANNYLNYVTGHARSDILGTLTGGGHIYLVNPNGILIGDGAVINVGHLHLSTRTLTDDVMNSFVPDGTNSLTGAIGGDVINLGRLNADTITVEGNNITFKNTAEVTKGGTIGNDGKITGGTAHNDSAVSLTANSGGEIHIGSDEGGALPGYAMSGTDKKYMYKLVSTPRELQDINNDISNRYIYGKYMLKNDIDWSGFGSFTPIAYSSDSNFPNYFAGRFDGLGYQIKNITINNSDASYVGLFAYNQGVIENVGLVGGSVKGTSANCKVGGIVGFNEDKVRNVWNTAAVEGTGENALVGGIVGYNYHKIERAYNTGAVTGAGGEGTGGIAGKSKGGTVSQVFNTGTVQNRSSGKVGGIVGYIENYYSTLENAYNTGAVTADTEVGGVVGHNAGIVKNVYNTGAVTGNNNVGGIIGINNKTLTNGYSKSGAVADPNLTYNKLDTVGMNGGSSYNVRAKSEDALKLAATFNQGTDEHPGFGFTDGVTADGVWRIYEGNTTPLLTAFLTRRDNYLGELVYDGTKGDVGTNYLAPTLTSTQAEGIDWASNVAIVTPRPLAVSFGNISKTYDGTTNATAGTATLDGKIDGDDVSLNTTNLAYAYEDKNAGENKTVNYTGIALSGEKAKNYNLTSTTYDNTASTISKADITVSVGDITKTYDGTTKTDDTTDATGGAFTVTSGTLYDGDTISGTKAFDTKDAGTGNKTVTLSDVTISDADGTTNNYNISTVNNTTSTINQRPLTVTFDYISKTYDGTTSTTGVTGGTETLDGKVDMDNLNLDRTNLSSAYADKNAGDGKNVYYSGIALEGSDVGNYALTSTTATGRGSIHKAGAHITAFADTTKTYDGTTAAPLGAATLSGIIDADLGKVGVTGTAAFTDDQNVGSNKPVSYSGLLLTGAEAGNYQLASTTGNGTGSITRRPLWLVANPVTITEGEATPTSWSGSVTGFVAGDVLGANDVYFFALDNPAATAVGSYSVTGTLSIDGGNPATSGDYGQNYTFANAAGNATAFTIEAKQVTPQEIIEEATNNQNAAKEYTDVVASLESGTNTVLPTTNNVLPTDGVMPTNSVLPTGNNTPTGGAQPTEGNLSTGGAQPPEAAQENNSASGEQNGAQEQNGLLPTQQTTGGQIAAGKQETQLGPTYTDINMPESMSVEALATSLNGGATQQGNAEAATNGPATEPTATTGGNMSGASEEDEA